MQWWHLTGYISQLSRKIILKLYLILRLKPTKAIYSTFKFKFGYVCHRFRYTFKANSFQTSKNWKGETKNSSALKRGPSLVNPVYVYLVCKSDECDAFSKTNFAAVAYCVIPMAVRNSSSYKEILTNRANP